jgi:hypothetical protein
MRCNQSCLSRRSHDTAVDASGTTADHDFDLTKNFANEDATLGRIYILPLFNGSGHLSHALRTKFFPNLFETLVRPLVDRYVHARHIGTSYVSFRM